MSCEQPELQLAMDRLSRRVTTIGEGADMVLSDPGVEAIIINGIRYRAGERIQALVQGHLNTHLVRETSVRGRNVRARISDDVVLDFDQGELYRLPNRWSRDRDSWPTTPHEWHTHWRPILEQVTSPKYY